MRRIRKRVPHALLISDDMQMEGIQQFASSSQGAKLAIAAGIDMVCFGNNLMNEESQITKKATMIELLEKNLVIAKKTYGNESLHLLKHLFVYFMCKMAISNH